jgi:lysozyme
VTDKAKRRGVSWPAAMVMALAASLGAWEGRELVPYRDIGGVWTVCDGITGADVIPGRTYTDAECTALLLPAIEAHMTDVERMCVPNLRELPAGVQFAIGHLAYNVGAGAVCRRRSGQPTTIARSLPTGNIAPACEAIKSYTRVAGKDCRDPANRCSGIPRRRDFESGVCSGDIVIPGLEGSTWSVSS